VSRPARTRPRLSIVAALALALLAGPARGTASAAPNPAAADEKARGAIVSTFVDAAKWFVERKRKPEAARALAQARGASPRSPALDELQRSVDALADEGGDAPADVVERWKKAATDGAKAWERLADLRATWKDDVGQSTALANACALDPAKPRLGKALAAVRSLASNKEKPEAAGLLLARLREADAEGRSKYDAIEQEMASSDLALVKAPDSNLVAWLSLPKGWQSKGEWPVLVAVEGAGCNFLDAARGFARTRGARRFLVLTPCSLSNTNALEPAKYRVYPPSLLEEWKDKRIDFDLPGLEAILDVLVERYHAEKKTAITGFSGGGFLCYALTMRDPARVWAAAPACANYQPSTPEGAEPVTDGGPPVHCFTGASDENRDQVAGKKPGIEGQTDMAIEAFQKLGFAKVERTQLPGVGHSACHAQVWAFLDEVLAPKK
jgi:poly(3-hydroxybutyrate) depolymerase